MHSVFGVVFVCARACVRACVCVCVCKFTHTELHATVPGLYGNEYL
jgi:hypothetical protein